MREGLGTPVLIVMLVFGTARIGAAYGSRLRHNGESGRLRHNGALRRAIVPLGNGFASHWPE